MQIPILIEPVENNGYRASTGEPLGLTADGPTCEVALANLRSLMQSRLQNGTRLVSLDVPTAADSENPWVKYAGMFKDDPDFDEVLEIMAENRRKMDADPDVP